MPPRSDFLLHAVPSAVLRPLRDRAIFPTGAAAHPALTRATATTLMHPITCSSRGSELAAGANRRFSPIRESAAVHHNQV
jgi:hypothetical protein